MLIHRKLHHLFRALLAGLTALLLAAGFNTLFGQGINDRPATDGVYQLSGMILETGDGLPVSFVRITVLGERRGTFSNETGFFSLPVTPGDSLLIRRIGYTDERLSVREVFADNDTSETYLYTTIFLTQGDNQIDPIEIYPYRNAYEVKMAMLNLPLPGEAPIEMAADNLQPSMLSAYAQELGINDAERLSVSQRQYLEYYMQRKSMSTVTLVDPAAVVRMIRYFGDKAESKRERVYNYWPE